MTEITEDDIRTLQTELGQRRGIDSYQLHILKHTSFSEAEKLKKQIFQGLKLIELVEKRIKADDTYWKTKSDLESLLKESRK